MSDLDTLLLACEVLARRRNTEELAAWLHANGYADIRDALEQLAGRVVALEQRPIPEPDDEGEPSPAAQALIEDARREQRP